MYEFMGNLFIPHPYLAFIPAALFGFAYARFKARFFAVTGILWGLYGFFETLNWLKITCTGECDIRIDLLLIYPVLILLTGAGVIYIVVKMARK